MSSLEKFNSFQIITNLHKITHLKLWGASFCSLCSIPTSDNVCLSENSRIEGPPTRVEPGSEHKNSIRTSLNIEGRKIMHHFKIIKQFSATTFWMSFISLLYNFQCLPVHTIHNISVCTSLCIHNWFLHSCLRKSFLSWSHIFTYHSVLATLPTQRAMTTLSTDTIHHISWISDIYIPIHNSSRISFEVAIK